MLIGIVALSSTVVAQDLETSDIKKIKFTSISLHAGHGFNDMHRNGFGIRAQFTVSQHYSLSLFYTDHSGTSSGRANGGLGTTAYSEDIRYLGVEVGSVVSKNNFRITPFFFVGKGFGGRETHFFSDIQGLSGTRHDNIHFVGGAGLSVVHWFGDHVGLGPEIRYTHWSIDPGALGLYVTLAGRL